MEHSDGTGDGSGRHRECGRVVSDQKVIWNDASDPVNTETIC
ncbi:hypothetical protein FRUB_07736 [Fimbriiglobus ruber]|uniref:Uncharacterized protein n=1 Tax=Fimbriiglobus ruber TaxID=1908690 RepID=A0A225DMD7_9BACT|nr:hypothetical protein FRUB_07736 [Fimbriiglobus ruber]